MVPDDTVKVCTVKYCYKKETINYHSNNSKSVREGRSDIHVKY